MTNPTPLTSAEMIAKLREMDAQATPGPWRVSTINKDIMHPTPTSKFPNAYSVLVWGEDDGDTAGFLGGLDDKEVIAWSRNSLTALADLLEQREKLLAEATALLTELAVPGRLLFVRDDAAKWIADNKEKLL